MANLLSADQIKLQKDLIWITKYSNARVDFGFRCNRFLSSALYVKIYSSNAARRGKNFKEGPLLHTTASFHTILEFWRINELS
jgi:hypothetical protein